MIFKNGRCVKISKADYEDVKFIISISSCNKAACDNVRDYLIKDRKVDKGMPLFIIENLAFNLVMAVSNNYKYMKVEEE